MGTLISTEEAVRFEPNQDFKSGFEFFGLPAVKTTPITPTEEIERESTDTPSFGDIETAENIAEEENLEDTNAEDQPLEIFVPDETIEEVQDVGITNEPDPTPIHRLEHIETPESDVTIDEEDKEAIEEPAELTDILLNTPGEDHEKEPETSTPFSVEEYVDEDSDIEEIPAIETIAPETEDEIQEENLLEEENPGQESHEEIYTPEPAEIEDEDTDEHTAVDEKTPSPFYATSSHNTSESTIQYTIPESGSATKNPFYARILIGIAVALVLALASYLLIPMLPESFKKPAITVDSTKKKAAVVVAPQVVDSASVEDSVSAQAQPAMTGTKELVKTEAAKEVVSAQPKTDTVRTFEIIGATVANQKEANHFIAQMKKSGITAKVVTNFPGKKLKMSIATFKDEKTARLERARLEKKLDIEGIYIYINNPK
ncbi:MAG: hypothetical protein EOO88_20325 [Pedobacter sp.]|nr:MAG: hypothetical protein EOO88_20325 [Pedobacter sp.]